MSSTLLPCRLLARTVPRSLSSAPARLLSHLATSPQSTLRAAPNRLLVSSSSQRRAIGTGSTSRAAAGEAARVAAKDTTSSVAGANARTSQHGTGLSEGTSELKGGLGGLGEQIPQGAVVYGAAGLLPYAGTSVATVVLAREATLALEGTGGFLDAQTALAMLYYIELLQIQYGAIILSFLGAIHWGLEFAAFGGEKGTARYLLGIAPVMAGWTSLLLAPQVALMWQWGSFLSMWYVDQRATKAGWTPSWYSTYRTYLSTVVMTTIFISLAGGNYFGPGSERVAENGGRWEPSGNGATSSIAMTGETQIERADDALIKIANVNKASGGQD